jgi:hypothetical protein
MMDAEQAVSSARGCHKVFRFCARAWEERKIIGYAFAYKQATTIAGRR